MNGAPYKAQVLERLRRAYQERQAWVAGLSEEARGEIGTAGRWSAKDFVWHFGFWHGYWAAQLARARRGEPPRGPDEPEPDNDALFAENLDRSWPEVLASADRGYRELVAQVEEASEEDLTGPQHGPGMYASSAGQRVMTTGYWHIFDHLAQYYAERGDVARATEIQEATAADRIAFDPSPRSRGIAQYNLACFYAIIGRPQEALARLPEALALAPELAEWAPQDSDLASLRTEPAYQALFATKPDAGAPGGG